MRKFYFTSPILIISFFVTITFNLLLYKLILSRFDGSFSRPTLEVETKIFGKIADISIPHPDNLTCQNINKTTASEVDKFVFFFGFSHCGSTVTGNIIDAHPNALIANEYDLFNERNLNKRLFSVSPCSKLRVYDLIISAKIFFKKEQHRIHYL